MSFRLFQEDSITPSTRTINVRNSLDSNGPHRLSFGVRTVVADALAGSLYMYCRYETPNGQMRRIDLVSGADLREISDLSGAMWYADQVLVIDKRYPLGDGPGVDPYGVFELNFVLTGTAGSSLIAYEAIVDVFDGSPAVTIIP